MDEIKSIEITNEFLQVLNLYKQAQEQGESTIVLGGIQKGNPEKKAGTNDGVRYSTEESREIFKKQQIQQGADNVLKKKKLNRSTEENFLFMFYELNVDLLKYYKLNGSNITRLIYLATYLSYTNILMLNEQTPMTKKDMQDKLKLSKNAFYDFYNQVIDCKILIEEDGSYSFNRKYFIKGNLTEMEKESYYARAYINTIRYLYENTKPKSHKSLSVLFRAIPYLSVEYNIICQNPTETALNLIRPMSLKELGEKLGYSEIRTKELKREFKNIITTDGYYILHFVTNGSDNRKDSMFINPDVVYGGHHFKEVDILRTLCKVI